MTKKKGNKSNSVDELTSKVKSMRICSFDMTFKFPCVVLEHMDHGQKVASVELLIISMHRRHFHIKMSPCGTVPQVKAAAPSLFHDANHALVANDDGSGNFNVNSNKAAAFQSVCKEISETANKDTDEVFGEPQLIKLPFECDEIFYKGHANDQEGWDIQIYDNVMI